MDIENKVTKNYMLNISLPNYCIFPNKGSEVTLHFVINNMVERFILYSKTYPLTLTLCFKKKKIV